jgi:RNA polymerase sigma-70 factor (ECF subfamily)
VEALSQATQAAASADELDIEKAYAEHAPFLARVLSRLTGPGAHVDDLLQDTFLIAHRKRSDFAGRSQVRTWLYGIAMRLASRHHRSARRLRRFTDVFAREPTPAVGPGPDDALERRQKGKLAEAALARLSFKQREVFVLYELEELSGREIAELLEIPEGTVWTRLHHARDRFTRSVEAAMEAKR